MPFMDRTEAGRKLAKALAAYASETPIVIALPRGGVPVAVEVAQALHAPLDLVLVRKIGVPAQRELAMGAVVDGPAPVTIRNEDIIRLCGVAEENFAATRTRELGEIERRRRIYLANRPRPDVTGKTVIVVDDGIATGATTRAALQALRLRKAGKIVLAVPVAPTETLDKLRDDADAIVCLEDHLNFGAIGAYYSDFRQLSDADVMSLLDRASLRSTGPL